jgi:hypothetical protein
VKTRLGARIIEGKYYFSFCMLGDYKGKDSFGIF